MPSRPDVIFVVLDTLRRDRLSAYGHGRDTSPRFDAFAQGGTLFERAIAPAQWTIPAHGSLFTGLYPSTHQLTQAYQQLAPAYPTLAEILQASGYHTVGFCNNPLLGVLENGLQRGFDHFFNYAGAAPDRPVDLQRSAARRAITSRFRRFARRISNRFAHNDALFRLSLHPWIVPAWSRMVNFKGNTARSVDDLIAYYEQHHAGGAQQPLFAFANLMGAHLPYHPSQQMLRHVAPDLAQDQHAFRYMSRHNASAVEWISPTEEPLADWQQRTLEGFYEAEIAAQDAELGRLLDALRRSGRLENTLVVLVADHGEGHGDHGYMGHSFVVYQELVHVPLLLHYPARFPADRRAQHNVSTRRIFHTILDVAGVPSPAQPGDPNGAVARLSLVNSVNGVPDPEAGVAFAEAFPPDNLLRILQDRQPQMVQQRQLELVRRGVYEGDYKLALVGDEAERLFNVAADPAEVDDQRAAQPQAVQALQAQVAQFVQRAEAQRQASSVNGKVSAEMLEQLRALGYVE